MMGRPGTYCVKPFFMNCCGDRLFVVSYEPCHEPRGEILYCPPFAEEMNKARRMVTLTAERLAQSGFHVLIPDLYGTGDSGGDFVDADFEHWFANLNTCANWLGRGRKKSPSLWGLRLGCNLILELVSDWHDKPHQVVLWQPVVSGKTYVTQFLRLQVAAELTGSDRKNSTTELRSQSEAGHSVEIAGYTLSPQLLAAVDSLDLRSSQLPQGAEVNWFEIVTEARPSLNAMSDQVSRALLDAGASLTVVPIVGEQFWSTVEVSVVPALVNETVACFAR